MVRAKTALTIVSLAVVLAGLTVRFSPPGLVGLARADEVTASVNNLRDGWDQGETSASLSPTTIGGGGFGQLFGTTVDGQVYAQPVIAGGVLIVATENDQVYGLNSATGRVIWSKSLGTPWPSAAEGCSDLSPNVGVTGTPVYDPSTGTVYMVAQVVPAGNTDEHPAFYMHAINAQTGTERPGWPVLIAGAPVNDPTVPFNSFTELQRPALLLLGGSVYAAFGSHCDFPPYVGYVAGVNTGTLQTTMWSDEAGPTDAQAGIWQSGGGLMSDGTGRIFFTSGNGVSPAAGPGSAPPPELAESVVRLAVQSDGSLAARDFFSPANAPTLDAQDTDFGSGAPVGLPFGTTALPDLLVQAGKDGRVFVLNRDSLGGREQGPGNTDRVVSQAGPFGGQWGHPAVFADTPTLTTANVGTANDYVYYAGKSDSLRYLRAGLDSSGNPVLSDVANSTDTFGYSSGSPVVTSNGTDPTSAVVWVVKSVNENGATGALEAFPAVPPGSCLATAPCSVSPLWTFPFANAGKFTMPATDNGRVYFASRGALVNGSYQGQVFGFGSPAKAPLTGAAPVDFGSDPVGTALSTSVTVTNTAAIPVTVTAVAATSSAGPDPFAATGPFVLNQASAPVTCQPGQPTPNACTLNPGDTLTASNVTFTPAAPGGATGSLDFSTDYPNFPDVGVSLSGLGTKQGFYAQPSAAFGTVPVGVKSSQLVTVTNGGSTNETLTAASLAGTPFTVTGLPSPTTQIAPQQTVQLTVTYAPTTVNGNDTANLTLTGTDPSSNTTQTVIALTGTGSADVIPTLTAAPTSIAFGSVPLGQQAQRMIDVTNSGNLPAIITVTRPPSLPYGAPDPIAAGLPVNPGYDVRIPVTFTPASIGATAASYTLTWTDVAGSHQLAVPVTGTGVQPTSGIAVPPPGGGWRFNGSAYMTGSSLVLTNAAKGQDGSAVYPVPEPTNGLKATFTVKIGGGTGADGMTFSMLDASSATQTSLGAAGGELGFGGLPGVAVALDTHKNPGYPSSNFIGIATGAAGGVLKFAATASNIPALRTGTHVIGVSISNGQVVVTVDGKQYLAKAVKLPPSVLLGFTGATGNGTDAHTVTTATITANGAKVPPPGGGWSYNSSAVTLGPDTQLTPAAPSKAGTVVYPKAVNATGLSATFNAQFGASPGGDGMTFALLDPSKTTATSVGGNGPMMGLGGLAGVGVVLGTDTMDGYPKNEFITLTVTTIGSRLKRQLSAQGVGPLHGGTHTVTVTVTHNATLGEIVTIFLDGVQVLQQSEPTLTSTVRLAFTGGTGTGTQIDQQIIRNAAISAAG